MLFSSAPPPPPSSPVSLAIILLIYHLFTCKWLTPLKLGTHNLQVALCPPRIEPIMSLSVVKHNRRCFITIMTIVTAEDHFLCTLTLLCGHCGESLETTWHLWWITETNRVWIIFVSVVMHFERNGWKLWVVFLYCTIVSTVHVIQHRQVYSKYNEHHKAWFSPEKPPV